MFKRNHAVMLLAASSFGLPLTALAETAAETTVEPVVAAAGQQQAGKLWNTVTGESLKDTVVPGAHTGAWLTLQRSGTAASANPQAASAVQREKAADRFLKTYDFPIKESFYGDGFKSGSN